MPFCLAGQEVGLSSHVLVVAQGCEAAAEAAERLSEALATLTGARLLSVPEGAWARSVHMHAGTDNDGRRARIPVIVGEAPDAWRLIGYGGTEARAAVLSVPYESRVFLPEIGEVVELSDVALVLHGGEGPASSTVAAAELLIRELEGLGDAARADLRSVRATLDPDLARFEWGASASSSSSSSSSSLEVAERKGEEDVGEAGEEDFSFSEETPETGVDVEPMSADLMDAVLRIQEEAYRPDLRQTRQVLEGLLALYPGGCWVVRVGGEVAGYALSRPAVLARCPPPPDAAHEEDWDCLYVHSVAIAPRHRQCGLGRMLFYAIEALAADLSLTTLALAAVQDSHEYWARYGFTGPHQLMVLD